MKLRGFFDELASRFTRRRSVGTTTVLVPEPHGGDHHPDAVHLEEIAARFVDPCANGDVSSYECMREDTELIRTAVSAVWTSSSPPAWDDQIELIRDQSRHRIYVCLPPNSDYGERPWLALAALADLVPGRAQDAFLSRLLEDRGASYGVEIWGSLPTEITNYFPWLFSRAGMLDACYRLLERERRDGNDQWPEVIDSLRRLMLERELVGPETSSAGLFLRALETFRSDPQSAHDHAEARRLAEYLADPANRSAALEAYFGFVYAEERAYGLLSWLSPSDD